MFVINGNIITRSIWVASTTHQSAFIAAMFMVDLLVHMSASIILLLYYISSTVMIKRLTITLL